MTRAPPFLASGFTCAESFALPPRADQGFAADPARSSARRGGGGAHATLPWPMSRVEDIRSLADEDVMQLVQGGDPRAFEILYDRHGGAAFSMAYRVVGDRLSAEDI